MIGLKQIIVAGLFVFSSLTAFATGGKGSTAKKADTKDSVEQKYVNWYNKDPKSDKIQGVGTEKAYELLKNKKPRVVVVAIIDSGVDPEHEDLKDNMWINTGEIPGNGIDDDGNGYVDDIHGWNFLGNAEGENVSYATMEITRLYRKYNAQFDGRSESDINDSEKKDYEAYLEIKDKFETSSKNAADMYRKISIFRSNFMFADSLAQLVTGKENYTLKDLKELKIENEQLQEIMDFLYDVKSQGLTIKGLDEMYDHYNAQANYQYNVDFDERSIIGDNPEDMNERHYGNNDVKGTFAGHGTHVAGIVAAIRGNGVGADGIANHVKIMALRAVPNGDEADKDVANAIRYAVDNGAHIINMSFGKDYSPNKDAVDAAVIYAQERGVLLIHAAGNDASNNDLGKNYPNPEYYSTATRAPNWMEVGAISMTYNKNFVAGFSNYGKNSVDLFAPGVNIYSTTPDDTYEVQSGTSMAAPAATGVAALVWAYYPELSAEELRELLLESVYVPGKKKVYLPAEGKRKKKVKLKDISVTGGVINAYEAVKLAEEKYSGQ